jgi:hypothetical protein
MKRLMNKFDLLDSYWKSVIKTTIEDKNTIRFQLKIPFEGFDVHEYGDFSFMFNGDNVSIKYRDNPLGERHSDIYNVNKMSILLDDFIDEIKNEEYLCGERFLWHLSEVFGLDNIVYVGLAEGFVPRPESERKFSREEMGERIRAKLTRNKK